MPFERLRLQPTVAVSGEHGVECDLNAEHDEEQRAQRCVRHVHYEVTVIGVSNAIIQPSCEGKHGKM